jgi:hypothetical protein
MNDLTLVEIIKPFENLDDVARNKLLVEPTKGFESVEERSVLDVSGSIR